MAKKSMVARNERRVSLAKKYQEKRAELKSALNKCYKEGKSVWDLQLNLQALPRDSNPNRIRSRCFSCNRPRANYRIFKLCRICIRKLAMSGQIPGCRKSSW